jgi:deoxycytidine triphosphate deaminase
MSVIPLTTDGVGRSVVQTQDDFKIDGDAVLISDLDIAQLKEARASNVSYDLRVGKKYRDHREDDPKEIPVGGVVTLNPGSALIIQTEEYVHFPRSRFGMIAPKVRLLENGLSTTFSKVDPGYSGHLLITLFNLGQRVRTLHRGSPFCALTVVDVADGARLYEKGPQEITARLADQPRRTLRELMEPHLATVTLGLLVATFLLTVVTAFDIWSRTHP